jgi:cell division protein FtsW
MQTTSSQFFQGVSQGTGDSLPYRGEGWEAAALALLAMSIFAAGLVQLYSASAFMAQSEGLPAHFYVSRQIAGGVAGIVMAFALAHCDYRRLAAMAWPLLIVVWFLLLLTVLPGTEAIAPRIQGARRWLNVGITIQPSEFAKLALIIWTAQLAVRKHHKMNSLRQGLAPFLVVWLVTMIPVALQPNFSAMLLLALLATLVVFAGGARIGHFILLGLVAVPVAAKQLMGAGYRSRRIEAFLDPLADTGGISYQIHQSLIAIGSGGVKGVGFGESQQKFGFLPEPHNDFLFSMMAEEWGLFGVAFVLLLFGLFLWMGYRIASRAPDLFGYLLAVGMTNLVVVTALLHMGVAVALLPTTGVVLPFMSYGRSALLVCFIAVGVLMSVARAGVSPGRTPPAG